MNKTAPSTRFAVGAAWIFGLGLLLGAAYVLGLNNSLHLWQLERAVASVRHPPQTRRLAQSKKLGLLVGNGNHCDFFVAELRDYSQTNLTPRQIRAFYARTKIWNPLDERYENVDVATVENGVLRASHDWDGTEQFIAHRFGRNWPRSLAKQKVYVLFNFSIGYDPGCDIRCH